MLWQENTPASVNRQQGDSFLKEINRPCFLQTQAIKLSTSVLGSSATDRVSPHPANFAALAGSSREVAQMARGLSAVPDLIPLHISQCFLRGIYTGREREGEKLQNYNYSTDKEGYKINEQSPCSDKSA